MTADSPLRLDLVSPLPPARTGIADYSADLLPHLAACCDVRVVEVPGEGPSVALRERWGAVALAELGRERDERGGERARLPLYQMGNNFHHRVVREAALRTPGVVVLHDAVLHHFHLDRTLGQGDFVAYREQARTDHDELGERIALPARWGAVGNAAQFALPMRRSLLLAARGVLVHSEFAAAELCDEEPRLRVAVVPMPVPLPPPADAAAGQALRQRLGIPAAAPLLGSVGFQTPMKRTPAVVRALARPPLAAAHLVVAGELSPYLDLEGLARELGVAARVHVLGYLPFAELEEVIAASDLCLNLRYPSAGETSASLLRTLALGRAALVSDYAQFRELPDEVALKVPVDEEDEAAALATRVGELLAAPERLRAMGEAARRYVARVHDPAAAAAALVAACRPLADALPLGVPSRREAIPTSLTWGVLPGSLAVEGVAGWRAGERRTLRVRLRNTSPARWLAAARGQGGVALRIEAVGEQADRLSLEWMPLPVDLPPGGEHTFTLTLRRPSGALRLRFLPRLLGMDDLARFGGPFLEADV